MSCTRTWRCCRSSWSPRSTSSACVPAPMMPSTASPSGGRHGRQISPQGRDKTGAPGCDRGGVAYGDPVHPRPHCPGRRSGRLHRAAGHRGSRHPLSSTRSRPVTPRSLRRPRCCRPCSSRPSTPDWTTRTNSPATSLRRLPPWAVRPAALFLPALFRFGPHPGRDVHDHLPDRAAGPVGDLSPGFDHRQLHPGHAAKPRPAAWLHFHRTGAITSRGGGVRAGPTGGARAAAPGRPRWRPRPAVRC